MDIEFPQDQPIGTLLPLFYQQYNLEADGGYDADHVTMKVARNYAFYIPNWNARRKALLKHDIHHMVTGYKSDFKGELEIASWEVGSGCWPYWAALALDLHGPAFGFWINLPRVFKAFVLGLRTRNLYSDIVSDKDVVNMTLQEVRDVLGLTNSDSGHITLRELLLFCFWLMVSAIYSVCSIVLLPLIVLYSLFIGLRKSRVALKA
jgi:hypothetical protein